MNRLTQVRPESVAIVGMSCRVPGAATLDAFWDNLRAGVESIRTFSDAELLSAGIDSSLLAHSDYVKAHGALEDVAGFDATLFGFNPREADTLDPQQRLFLECAWEALEHAGYAPNGGLKSAAIFAGAGPTTYLLDLHSSPDVRQRVGDYELRLANDKDNFATRVAYKLNLQGPSVTVQTACSTSLVSVVMAYQALLMYECDVSLAGGAALSLPQMGGYLYREGGILASDGHCRAFDAAASGTVPGSGAGVVVMKRLSDAIKDGDTVYAVIRGGAINNDGADKVGFTAPSVNGQARVIAAAHTLADVSADDISYVEAHGTGTPLGDPIELAALTQAFRTSTDRRGFCAIGSVKTNIGHLDAAAGIAGLIKTVLALHNGELPPSLHFNQPNAKLALDTSPFFVNAELRLWPTGSRPRLAGVSSFGIGGTNAHVVLEEAPPSRRAPVPDRPAHLLVLSAASSAALDQAGKNLTDHLEKHPEQHLGDVAHTLQVGRAALAHRRMLVGCAREDLVRSLRAGDARPLATEHGESSDRPVAFLFPGQGGQHTGMARELYDHEPAFRRALDRCCDLLQPHLGVDLREIIYPLQAGAPAADQVLEQMGIAQPAVFAVEYALAQWWLNVGVQPQAMLGHSLGEFAAACLAGVFSLEDAIGLVAARGRLMQSTPAGMMLAVALGEAELRARLGNQMAVAAVNSPRLCVAAGPLAAGEELEALLLEQGISSWRLRVTRASHSPMMDSVLDEFRAHVARVPRSAPSIPFVSNVTGTWITADQAVDPGYWASHLRSTARFADGLDLLVAQPEYLLLEVGPGQSLTRLAASHPSRHPKQPSVASLPHPTDEQPELSTLLTAVGRLWLAGLSLDWGRLGSGGHRVALPTYSFDRTRHWIDTTPAHVARGEVVPTRRADPADWLHAPSWRRTVEGRGRAADLSNDAKSWLVFCDALGLGERLATRLETAGQRVSRVSPASRFEVVGDRRYTIDPRDQQAYQELLSKVSATGDAPDRVVHLWSVTESSEDFALDHVGKTLDLGFYSLLFLAQALGQQPGGAPVEVTAIASDLHVVLGDESIQPEKATLLGPCTVVPQEYPNLAWRSIDVGSFVQGGGITDVLVERLLDELAGTLTASARTVAYRGAHRWVPEFEAIRADAANGSIRLRERGVYLITGGLGGVGLALAEYLARSHKARLVLVGRSEFPPRAIWAKWLNDHPEDDPISTRIRRVGRIEASGGAVLVLRADVADPAAVEVLLGDVKQQFGVLHGVIHAAGIEGEGIVQFKTREAVERVLAPKLAGTLVLAAALRETPPDFLVLCSSLSAILGGAGQVDYSAANAFLDAFAGACAARGDLTVVSMNWDAWEASGIWARTMAKSGRKTRQQTLITDGMQPEQGAQAFAYALAVGLPQVIVSTRNFAARARQFARPEVKPAAAEGTPAEPLNLHARPDLNSSLVLPNDEVEVRLASIWQDLLGIQEVGIHDNFFELGGHSLLGIQLTSRIRETFHVECPLERLFTAPTIAGLAAHVRRRTEPDLEEVMTLVDQLSEDDLHAFIAQSEALLERT